MIFENYYAYRAGLWLINSLPRNFVYFVVGALAELNFFFNGRSRRGVYANLARALPPNTGRLQHWRMARAIFRNFAYAIVDFFHIPSLNRANLDRYLAEVKGMEFVHSAIAAGHGGIFVTVHMGSWELGGACMGLLGVPLTVAALKHKDPRVEKLFVSTREAGRMEVVPLGGALAKLQEALTRGRFIALVSDRDVKGTGLRLLFFDQPARVPSGHAKLALNTGAWILPATTYRLPDNRIVIDIRPPIIPDPATDTEESLTQRTLVVLEEFIRRHPEQWLSFFNLWSETELPMA